MTKEEKRCTSCGEFKPLDQFTFVQPSKKRPNGRLESVCKQCRVKYEIQWRNNNPKKARARDRRHYVKFREKVIARESLRRETNKQKCFDEYGWVCACCGEDDPHFLTLDHIVSPKSKTDSEKKTLYSYLVKHNFPKGIQTLCWNCNMAKHIYKSCPHQWEEKSK